MLPFHLPSWLSDNNRKILGQGLIVLVTIAVAAVFAPRIAQIHKYAYLILMAIVGILGVGVLIKFPQFGLVGLVGATLVVPFSYGTGSESSLNISFLMVGLMAGLMMVDVISHQLQLKIIYSRPILPIFAMLVISVLAFISGQLLWFATQPAPFRAQVGGLGIFVLSYLALLLVVYHLQDIFWLKLMTWVFLALSPLHILVYIFPSIPHLIVNGATGSLFWTWFPALAISQAVINKRLALAWRYLLGGMVVIWLYVSLIITRAWVSGWLPGLVSILVIVWLYEKKLRFPIFLFILIGLMIKLQSIYSFIMVGDNQYSVITRLAAWRLLEEIIRVNPILGVGFANYYWYTPLFPIMGYSVVFNSHNNYIDIIAQTGFLGLICFLWLALELGRMGLSLKEKVPEGFAKAYIYGALGGLAGTLVAGLLGDWFLPFVYNVGFTGFRASILGWLFLGGLVAIDQILRRNENAQVI